MDRLSQNSFLLNTLNSHEKVYLPWNVPSYLPLNGFHNLLKRILPQKQYFAPNLMHTDFHEFRKKMLVASRSNLEIEWARYKVEDTGYIFHESQILRKFDMDFQIHHTRIPSTTSHYLLHYESPETLFYPLRNNSKYDKQNFEKDLMKLLSAKNKGTITHVGSSKEELENFVFEITGEKLNVSKINLKRSLLPGLAKKPKIPTILFTNSQNQNPNNFVERGGVVFLNSLEAIFRSFPEIRVIILGSMPTLSQMREAGLTTQGESHISRCEIYTKHLRLDILNSFMAKAWVLVIPSLNLHTDTVARGIEHGCKVISTKPYGIDTVFTDKELTYLQTNNPIIEHNHLDFRINSKSGFISIQGKLSEELSIRIIEEISNFNLEDYSNQQWLIDDIGQQNIAKLIKAGPKYTQVSENDWNSPLNPMEVLNLGEKAIYNWNSIYFKDSKSGQDYRTITTFSPNILENLQTTKASRHIFGFKSFVILLIALFIRVLHVKNAELIFHELKSYNLRQFWHLTKKRIAKVL